MKRTLVIAAMGVLVSGGVALAGDPDVGCGWGTHGVQGTNRRGGEGARRDDELVLGNQTFGISSGTAGCNRVARSRPRRGSTCTPAPTSTSWRSDMAAGQGESLDTLAQLIGVTDADKPAFFR